MKVNNLLSRAPKLEVSINSSFVLDLFILRSKKSFTFIKSDSTCYSLYEDFVSKCHTKSVPKKTSEDLGLSLKLFSAFCGYFRGLLRGFYIKILSCQFILKVI